MPTDALFLGGGGDIPQSRALDELYFASLPVGARILYIPVALERDRVERTTAPNAADWFTQLLSTFTPEATPDKKFTFHLQREADPIPSFNDFHAIYIGGGNTFKLLDYIYQHSLCPALAGFIASGRPVYGGSAGAIIFGKDISTAEPSDHKGDFTRIDGLNYLQGISIDCHYAASPEYDARLMALSKKIGSSILALPEDAGLVFTQDLTLSRVIGQVTQFQGSTKQALSLASLPWF